MAEWTTAYINDLPDSAFLYIEPGGDTDEDDRTVPRSLRHFPYKDAAGNVDLPHLRNALARIPQSSLPQSVKDRVSAKAERILASHRPKGRASVEELLNVESVNPETAERPFLVRRFEAVAMEVEGRTVDVRVVKFGEVARVADPPSFEPYDEEWTVGVFDHQLNAANRLHANYEHERGISNVVGHGVSLRSEPDGYHASFKIHNTPNGETALELLRDGALPSVSLEAFPVKSVRTNAGVVQRIKANLRGVAFCREGAFPGAQVLAVRNAIELDEELLPVATDPEMIDRCRRLGIKLPQRYAEAHPAEGTPDDSGTPEDGTRPEEEPTFSEV